MFTVVLNRGILDSDLTSQVRFSPKHFDFIKKGIRN